MVANALVAAFDAFQRRGSEPGSERQALPRVVGWSAPLPWDDVTEGVGVFVWLLVSSPPTRIAFRPIRFKQIVQPNPT